MDSFLIPALTTLGYAVPELLACGIALAMLWTSARPGKERQLGLAGIGVMFACAVLQMGLGLYQNWTIHSLAGDSAAQIGTIFARLGIVRLLVNCVSLAGLVIVVRALCKATQGQATR